MYEAERKAALDMLEKWFEAGHVWLAGDQPTIADIDLFGVVVFADESGDDLTAYPAIRGWMDRFSALPHFAPPSTLLPPESRKAV